MMINGSGDSGTVLLYLILSLAISWLIVYTAVRAAVGHVMDRAVPRLVAEAITTADGVHFAISNLGTAPAVDMTVRWFLAPADQVMARAALLGVNGRFQWTVPVAAAPDERMAVRKLHLDWAHDTDPSLGRRSSTCPVLVPSRLNAAE
jgi:hypothetical protein